MKVVYIGRENKPGVKKYIDYYYAEKRTGKFLVLKYSNRSREFFSLYRNINSLVPTPLSHVDIEYKNLTNDVVPSPVSFNTVLAHVYNVFFNSKTSDNTTAIKDVSMSTLIKYQTQSGLILEGTFDQIKTACAQIGEIIDLKKFLNIDLSQYHYSETKNTLVLLKDMDSRYIMNSIAKKIRNYFDKLKTNKTKLTPNSFLEKIGSWDNSDDIKVLVDELKTRVTTQQ